MTEFIKLKTPRETIQIGFTGQKVSGRAGLMTFAGFLHWHRLGQLLARVLPHHKTRGIAVARLLQPVQRLLKKDMIWTPTEVPGTKVAEVWHQQANWRQPRWLVLLRHLMAEKQAARQRTGGKKLIDCPGYLYQALVTNLPASLPPLEVWRQYNPRAGCEEVIKQLDADFALPKLCLKNFWSTEAALSLAVLGYNLTQLFQRHLGWMDRVTAATLRFRLFSTGGIISQSGGVRTIRLAVREPEERAWWRRLLEKTLSLMPNCNAVPQAP